MLSFKNYIFEASLAGNSTRYKRKTAGKASGNFYQYVEMNPDLKTLKMEAPAFLYQMDGTLSGLEIKKGEEIEIVGREEKTLKLSERGALLAHVKYKRNEYLVPLSKILKPSGKEVKPIEADLSEKENPNVFKNFKAGHGHEGQVVQRFINSSGPQWEFEHKGKMYSITYLGAPTTKTAGNPKTDVVVLLDKKIPGLSDKLYISLKDENATYFENWMLPERFHAIFPKQGKRLIEDALAQLNKNNRIGRSGFKSITVCPFIKNSPYNSVKLDKNQKKEATSGRLKFGKTDATANCFFAGKVPDTISEMIDRMISTDEMAGKVNLGLDFRGSNEIKNSSVFIKDDKGGWVIRENWIAFKPLKLDPKLGQSK